MIRGIVNLRSLSIFDAGLLRDGVEVEVRFVHRLLVVAEACLEEVNLIGAGGRGLLRWHLELMID